MRRKICVGVAACTCLAAVIAAVCFSGRNLQAQPKTDGKPERLDDVKKAIADGKLPDNVKRLAAEAKNPTYGKVFSLWPMSNGTFYFAISTPKGAVGFTFRTGDLTADAMLKVLLFAYEKQVAVWVFDDPAQPQVATGVVTITP